MSSSSSSSSNEYDDDTFSNKAAANGLPRGARPRPQRSSDGPGRARDGGQVRHESTSTEDDEAPEGIRPHDSLMLPRYRDIRKWAYDYFSVLLMCFFHVIQIVSFSFYCISVLHKSVLSCNVL